MFRLELFDYFPHNFFLKIGPKKASTARSQIEGRLVNKYPIPEATTFRNVLL